MNRADLLGRREPYGQISTWLKDWRGKGWPLIVTGTVGCGKTTVVETLIHDANLYPLWVEDPDKLRQTLSLGRSPTFTGQQRSVVIDDAHELISTSQWSNILDSEPAFPLVIISDTAQSIPKAIVEKGLVVQIASPNKHHLEDLLFDECEKLNLQHPDELILHIASTATSYRSALNALHTTPATATDSDLEARTPPLTGTRQAEAILRGQWRGEVSVHPLTLLNMAEWNSADPEVVRIAHTLHSRGWAVAGLSDVSKSYLRTLRSKTYDRPPFRERRVSGARRLQ